MDGSPIHKVSTLGDQLALQATNLISCRSL
jgi:hypothetical protein